VKAETKSKKTASKKTSDKKTAGKEPAKRSSSRKVNPILEGLPSKAVWPDPKPQASSEKAKAGRRK
jgi:hypothetical protein